MPCSGFERLSYHHHRHFLPRTLTLYRRYFLQPAAAVRIREIYTHCRLLLFYFPSYLNLWPYFQRTTVIHFHTAETNAGIVARSAPFQFSFYYYPLHSGKRHFDCALRSADSTRQNVDLFQTKY